jgi:hypothetical protein
MASSGFASVTAVIGTYNNWPTTWTPVAGSQDANDVADTHADDGLDFVGDATNPMLYYADNGSYFFCRMRVDMATYATPSGAHLWLIDVVGEGKTGIDAAFSWDSKSADDAKHGLEMSVVSITGTTWGDSKLDDIDESIGKKLYNDINGSGRTTDGYIRVDDAQLTTNFDKTTFIDFAVSWSYLKTYTTLTQAQTWRVNVASIANATDHGAFSADVGGANLTDPITTGWSAAAIPEPTSAMLLSLACTLTLGVRRRRPNH